MIRWGILGLGNMGNHFSNAAKEVNDIKINVCYKQHKFEYISKIRKVHRKYTKLYYISLLQLNKTIHIYS